MAWPVEAAALAVLALIAWTAARFPRALFCEAGGRPHARRAEFGLAAGLFVVGATWFEAFSGSGPVPRVLTGLALMACLAIVYADIRYLIIPDLYSAAIAGAGVALNLVWPVERGPQGLIDILFGVAVCGGMLGAVAWVWKRVTAIEGLGMGDVKLAAALGAVLGAQAGVWAITASAAGGAALGLILQARTRGSDAPLLFPYGAPLALAGGGLLLWERWS